jgi:hypothetical protein
MLLNSKGGGVLATGKAQALSGAQPMFPKVMGALQPFFPSDVMQSVKYRTMDTAPVTLDGAAMILADTAAITLEDVTVRRPE